MRPLIVLPHLPIPEGGAGGRVAVGMIRGLRMHGIDVRTIAAQHHWEQVANIPPDLDVEVVAVRAGGKFVARYIEQIRHPMAEMRRGAFSMMISELAKDADLLHLVEPESIFCAEGLTLPSLTHMYCLVRRDRSLGVPWRSKTRWGVETLLAERQGFRKHRYLVANSPEVASELRRVAPHAEVVHVPLTLDPAYYPEAPLDGPPVAGLIGTASWPPTERSVRRVITDIWPRVRRIVPDARLLIAGRGLADMFPDVPEGLGIEVVGEVPSAVGFLHRLGVLLYPLDRGSGMKVKVLESIACGLPVVTTPEGAEGIDAGAGVIVESDADRLAVATAEILTDTATRKQRGEIARRAFEDRYSPMTAMDPLVDLYRRMATRS